MTRQTSAGQDAPPAREATKAVTATPRPTRARRVLATAVAVWLGAGPALPAWADDAAPAVPIRFTSLAPDGARSEVDGELTVGHFDTDDRTDASGLHFDAQYVTARGAGGYARVGAVDVTDHAFYDKTTLVGTEIGGLQRLRAAWGMVTGRAGVSFPTTSGSRGVGSVAYARRPSDSIWLADAVMLRLAATPTLARGAWTARLDVGVDHRIDRPSDGFMLRYHIDVALGLQHGHVGATAEYSVAGQTGEYTVPGSTATYALRRRHVVTFGGQYRFTRTIVSLRIGTPFETGELPDYGPPPPGAVNARLRDPGEVIAVALGVSLAL